MACGGVLAVAMLVAPDDAFAQWAGQAGLGGRGYPERSTDPASPDWEVSLSLSLDRVFSFGDGHFLSVSPSASLDPATSARSRFDLRDLSWEHIRSRWEFVAGLRRVSWGVAESGSLVDVVNQVDFGEDATAPTRLGQPMAGVRLLSSVGVIEGYLLPFFRERRFVGRGGALWNPLPVGEDQAEFEHPWGRGHVDWVLRWSHILGDFDFGLSHFAGTNRQPRLVATADPGGTGQILVPHYDLVDETSLAAQWTRDVWLFKLELLRRASRFEDFAAMVGGIEYAVADYLSLFVEYLYDGRGTRATTSVENDVFAGARLLTQEWTVSTRVFVDHRSANTVHSTTASRRLGGVATAELDGRLFRGDSSAEPSDANRLDSYVALTLSYYF